MRKAIKLRALLASAFAPALLTIAGLACAADEVFSPTAAITIPGNNLVSFDIGYVDAKLRLYFLADRSNKSVDVIDTTTNTVVTQLQGGFSGATGNSDTSGPNGVLTLRRGGGDNDDNDNDGNRNDTISRTEIWAGDGNSTVKVIDLGTGQLTHTIATGGTDRADELCYDPRDRLILMANDADTPPFITFISATTYTVVGRITMDGLPGHGPNATNGIEQCQWDHRTGKFYLNLPEVNGPGNDSVSGAVLKIDPKTMKIEQVFTIPVAKCAGPQGMAIGPEPQILLGCHATASAIIDERNGAVIASFNNEAGSDEVWFNPGDNHYFLGLTGATPPVLGVIDAGQKQQGPRTDQSVPTGAGAHSVAADARKNQVYVPIRSGSATICGAHGGNDVKGCVAVMTTPHDDDGKFAHNDRR
ncbi:MAG: hypothetical protein QOI12_583 [Alphaproteobacteria bacterium]|jgi:hypothetical protein|nr:hypothetical protein [Alphaproteobacteria bacterium]